MRRSVLCRFQQNNERFYQFGDVGSFSLESEIGDDLKNDNR